MGWKGAAAALLVLLSGCVANEPAAIPSASHTVQDASRESAAVSESAPRLGLGDSWTYSTGGYWDTVPSVTIVLAQADASGFLFAAASREQLDDEIAWELSYFGRADASLRAMRDEKYGGGLKENPLFDFPLFEGKTWNYFDVEVVAQRENITVLGKTVPGWRIFGEDERKRVTIEYDPGVRFVTWFEDYSIGSERALFSLKLESYGTSSNWVWLTRGAEVVASDIAGWTDTPTPNVPKRLDVTDADDTVFVWSVGTPGSRGAIVPPRGEPWLFEAEGENVKKRALDAATGSWTVSGAPGAPGGGLYIQAHAIDWIGSE